jgi:hypothetical protein
VLSALFSPPCEVWFSFRLPHTLQFTASNLVCGLRCTHVQRLLLIRCFLLPDFHELNNRKRNFYVGFIVISPIQNKRYALIHRCVYLCVVIYIIMYNGPYSDTFFNHSSSPYKFELLKYVLDRNIWIYTIQGDRPRWDIQTDKIIIKRIRPYANLLHHAKLRVNDMFESLCILSLQWQTSQSEEAFGKQPSAPQKWSQHSADR